MKWVVIVFLFFCIAALERRVQRNEAEARAVALEQACRTIVEAGLVRSCTVRENSLQSKQ